MNLIPKIELLALPEHIGLLRLACGEGDRKVRWQKGDKPSEDNARRIFDEKIGAKWFAFKQVKKTIDGVMQVVGEKISKFDAKAEVILLMPPVAGG